ncbi:Hypothetical protein ADU72_0725 [Pediococcus damnosus]|uniref:Uncharacterized protein n=1 Tax=Pediococcus damnosus TaxID=51663 RepID=A0ABM6A316_9LACO|nr:Hypothetical protein ADU69_1178 [Pediococcus damnosus]AMV65147.1 Hypothetical protein ADU71_1251 [Pediococcus damnosus]AMV66670.1 Hypothetical protein ADU72_0725 [Pediococcus damnosus]
MVNPLKVESSKMTSVAAIKQFSPPRSPAHLAWNGVDTI